MIAKVLIVLSIVGWVLYVVFRVLRRPPDYRPAENDEHRGGV